MMGIRPSFRDLLPHSIVMGAPHPAQMTRSDAYAYTHSMMYLTDFGSTVSDGIDLGRMLFITLGYLAKYIAEFNLDLVVEMLMVARFLHAHNSPYYQLGRSLVVEIWDQIGFLPGPEFNPRKYESLEEQGRRWYMISQCYHTTFVAGMLFAIEASMNKSDYKIPVLSDPQDTMLTMCAQVVKELHKLAPTCAPIQPPPIEIEDVARRLTRHLSRRVDRIINGRQINWPLVADLALAKVMTLGDWPTLVRCCDDALLITEKPTFMMLAAVRIILERAKISQDNPSIARQLELCCDVQSFVEKTLPRWLFILSRVCANGCHENQRQQA